MVFTFKKTSKQTELPPPPRYTAHASRPIIPEPHLLAPPPNQLQIIENRYVDDEKLSQICIKLFGLGNYDIRYKSKKFYLSVPVFLDQETIDQCDRYYQELPPSA
ncbi:unnamed protein product [Periconia digitata]|uniref:Uncharacterized protein n=1 Tax=Periconia digitata TaxID=1303443 RepID=A0A9W4XXL7_9PLEO|nr:unnamed protein product [Periconia digitata]